MRAAGASVPGVELTLDPGVLATIAVTEYLYLRALRVLRRRGVPVAPLAGVAVARGDLAVDHRARLPDRLVGGRHAVRPHGPAPADRRPGRAAAARGGALARAVLPAPEAGAEGGRALVVGAAAVPRAAAPVRGRAGVRARPLLLALRLHVRGGGPPRGHPRAPARQLHRHRHPRVVVGDRSQAPPRPRRAVEGALHDRRALQRDVPRHGVRVHPRARLHRASTGRATASA